MRIKTSSLLPLLAMIVLTAFRSTASAEAAPYYIPRYTQDLPCSAGSNKLLDPINVGFAGPTATAKTVHELISGPPLEWDLISPLVGGQQHVAGGGQCHDQDYANALGFWHKHHMREFQLPGTQQGGDYVTVGDAHRDKKLHGDCGKGDVVPTKARFRSHNYSGYDAAQLELVFELGKLGPNPQAVHGGPTFMQCNPDKNKPGQPSKIMVPWDHNVFFFRLP